MLTKSIFIKRFTAELRTRLGDPDLNGAQLATALGMSRMHLHRHLQRYYQQAARDMITHERMRLSKRLLADNRLKVSEVSRRVGYEDPAYFSRVFRKCHKISPSAYRKAVTSR